MKKKQKVLIAAIEASFDYKRNNLTFNVQEGNASIHLVTDAAQMAEVAKLLLLNGKQKTFGVEFYKLALTKDCNARQHKKKQVIR